MHSRKLLGLLYISSVTTNVAQTLSFVDFTHSGHGFYQLIGYVAISLAHRISEIVHRKDLSFVFEHRQDHVGINLIIRYNIVEFGMDTQQTEGITI